VLWSENAWKKQVFNCPYDVTDHRLWTKAWTQYGIRLLILSLKMAYMTCLCWKYMTMTLFVE